MSATVLSLDAVKLVWHWVFRVAQYITDWRSELASLYSLYFQLG